ncbi:MAG TPA: ATP-binding protein [Verrucomicrobiae bacterium]|nr:ATP-binding protein [Verrucomicrobiae bacterium]
MSNICRQSEIDDVNSGPEVSPAEKEELAVLLLAPTGGDALITSELLQRHGFFPEICPDLHSLCARLKRPAGVLIVAEEGVASPHLPLLQKKLEEQEAWSDIPMILLGGAGSNEQTSAEAYRYFGGANINFLERPLRLITLVSTLRAAIRARMKQYQVRDLILQQKQYVENLTRTNQELDRKNRELEQFAYVASHDLQEPLRTVVTFCQMIETRLKGESDARNLLRYLSEAALRAKQLVSDLLSYSRVGAVERKLDWVDMNVAASQAAVNLKALLDESKAVVTQDNLPRLLGDPMHMTQLFQNLIGNAIKFKRETPPRVHLSCAMKKAQGREEWLFSVRDNGTGIDPQYWEKIFVIFQRLNTHQQGTGIGLAICRKIVEFYNGRIWVDSKPGEGSTFYFSMPKDEWP